MFEPLSQSLHELMMFAILGFLLAALYEPLRIIRQLVRTGTAVTGVSDFLFLAGCGVIVFAYSLELGAGHFRYFYIIGTAFGGAVYFLTVGRIAAFVTRKLADAFRRYVLRPLRNTVVQIARFVRDKIVILYKILENRGTLLKSHAEMKYNNRRRKISEKKKMRAVSAPQESQNGVQRVAIRARVRKV
jgi:hypothetical protein